MIDGPAAARPRARGIRRGAYLLPSLFTMGNMVFGFYAIICGLEQKDFVKASLFILLAAALDSVDGRIARMTGTESEFGKEYDSLADVITFGAAPGMLAYLWGLRELNEDAWLISVFYMVCTATRLARFNVQTRTVDSRWFVGLPSPWAALTICALLSFSPELEEYQGDVRVVMQVVMATALLLIGALMVSTFRYNSFKKLDLRRRWSYRAFVPI
ncbi:MAG TPA: CDP-diacylglycerol--serine O-phosphatidyltransferase, partial [Thermoanaerobaculia bacterium]